MATLKVVAPFTVRLDPVLPATDPPVKTAGGPPVTKSPTNGRKADDPTIYAFPAAGTYDDVPDDVANHWYTKTFLEGYEPPTPLEAHGAVIMVPKPADPPTPEEAQAVLTDAQRSAIHAQRAAEEKAKAAEEKGKAADTKAKPAAPTPEHPAPHARA